MKNNNPRQMRRVRHSRVRRTTAGSSNRPRLSVFRSLNHIYAQLIDDDAGGTLAAASSLEPALASNRSAGSKQGVSRLVGTLIAQRAKEKGVQKVVMDRGGYKYHGRVKALADAAREEGLDF